jgi:hypothetical protein
VSYKMKAIKERTAKDERKHNLTDVIRFK